MKKSKLLIIIGAIAAIISAIIIVVLTNTKEPIIYNITFDANGGTQVETQKIEEGNKVKKPTDPTKDGFLFVEWTYQNKTYDFSHKVTKDLNLMANWVEVKEEVTTFVVRFETDGGTTISNQIVEQGNKIEKPIDPIKDGYTFNGWYLNDEIYDFEKKVEEDVELIAKWEKIKEINKKTTTNNKKDDEKNNNNYNNNGATNNDIDENNENEIVDIKVEIPTLTPGHGSGGKIIYTGFSIGLEGYYTIKENMDMIDGWELYEKVDNTYKQLNGHDAETDVGETKIYVARAYAYNKENVKIYSGYSNEYKVDNSKVETPTLTPGHGSGGKIIYTGFSIGLEGYYTIKENMDMIDGWELYEKVGNTYKQLNGHDSETDIGETKIYVARAYAYNKENVKIYSGYSNEYKVDNSKVETPTLTPGHGSGGKIIYTGFSIRLEGYYTIKENMDNIDGWELYEKVGNTYNQLSGHDVETDIGETKIYVARVYAYNKENVKIYSGYSNEYKVDNSKVETPTLTPGHGSGGKIIYTGFSIGLEGYYAIKENMDNIDGWELYEKVGNTYNQLSGHDVETDIGETKIYVARVYAYNKENVKIYSGYSNEYILK